MLAVVRKRLVRALPLLAATLVVGVGSYFVGLSAIADLQSSQAEYAARSFGKYLMQEVPDLPAIANGSEVSGSAVDALSEIKPIGSVFKFSIYDPHGKLRVTSSPFAASHIVEPRNAFEDLRARGVAESGKPSFQVTVGDRAEQHLLGREVRVERALGGLGTGGDRIHRGALEAALEERQLGLVDDVLAQSLPTTRHDTPRSKRYS